MNPALVLKLAGAGLTKAIVENVPRNKGKPPPVTEAFRVVQRGRVLALGSTATEAVSRAIFLFGVQR